MKNKIRAVVQSIPVLINVGQSFENHLQVCRGDRGTMVSFLQIIFLLKNDTLFWYFLFGGLKFRVLALSKSHSGKL